jgi:hypothetical protein
MNPCKVAWRSIHPEDEYTAPGDVVVSRLLSLA